MNILQVCARIPSPPDDGGAVYMYNITKQLHRLGHHVILASFISDFHRQDKADIQKYATLYAKNGHFKPYGSKAALRSFLTRKSVNVQHRMNPSIMRSILSEVSEQVDVILLMGLYVAHFIPLLKAKFPNVPIVLQQVNVEHVLMQQNADKTKNPFLKFYLNDQTKLLKKFEFESLRKADAIITISDQDLNVFKKECPSLLAEVVPPGANVLKEINFSERENRHLLAISSWKWPPNFEGLKWFLNYVWNPLKTAYPDLKLSVIGEGIPSDFSKSLPSGVKYYGFVENLEPFKRTATLQIIPLISGSGVKLKVVEAISSGIPIVSTSFGVEGTSLIDGQHFYLADDPEKFTVKVKELLDDETSREKVASEAYQLAKTNYSWDHQGEILQKFLTQLITN